MKIKKNDNVIIISGKDKGKEGKVLETFRDTEKVIIDGLNTVKKHVKSSKKSESGEVIEKPMPMHVSNVALIDPKTKKATRVGYEMKDGKKVRVAKKTGQTV